MVAECIFVGTELLLGQIVNTNGAYLGRRLAELGIDQYLQVTVGDNPARLRAALAAALQRADVVITSGGLGPTLDDLTRETAAELAGRALRFDPALWEQIARGRTLRENMKRQAMVPEGATVLPNAVGTAPGLIIPAQERALMLLPGPPAELIPMFEAHGIPYLLSRMGQPATLVSRSLRFFDIGESAIAEALDDLIQGQTDPTLATYAKPGDVEVRISTKAADRAAGLARIAPVEAEIRRRLGEHLYGIDETTFEAAVGQLVQQTGRSLTVFDAWTGG
ncbi:MAG TPA: CinA family nicotinamide mononucleotide deamidase-related protein, partial [Limnochordia bacterium]